VHSALYAASSCPSLLLNRASTAAMRSAIKARVRAGTCAR
jgi:hypothetical protein